MAQYDSLAPVKVLSNSFSPSSFKLAFMRWLYSDIDAVKLQLSIPIMSNYIPLIFIPDTRFIQLSFRFKINNRR